MSGPVAEFRSEEAGSAEPDPALDDPVSPEPPTSAAPTSTDSEEDDQAEAAALAADAEFLSQVEAYDTPAPHDEMSLAGEEEAARARLAALASRLAASDAPPPSVPPLAPASAPGAGVAGLPPLTLTSPLTAPPLAAPPLTAPDAAGDSASAARPAPLVLGLGQRIDMDAPAQVRPRRISSDMLHEAVFGEGAQGAETAELAPDEAARFADYARGLGAVTAAEQIEAAAAYLAETAGQAGFNPADVLKYVTAVDPEDGAAETEDRLRAFGTLLRQGKITKVGRGLYAIAEASRFFRQP